MMMHVPHTKILTGTNTVNIDIESNSVYQNAKPKALPHHRNVVQLIQRSLRKAKSKIVPKPRWHQTVYWRNMNEDGQIRHKGKECYSHQTSAAIQANAAQLTHKYGLEVPRNVDHTLHIDAERFQMDICHSRCSGTAETFF